MSRAITCPSCGGTIAVKAAGYSVSVACQYCGSVLDVAHPDVKVIAEYHEAAARLDLPLGSRGVIFGTQWEAVGWLAREAGGYAWQEYLLFNPYAGYRWLVESGGEWQFGQMLTARPERLPGGWGWAGRRFAPEEGGAIISTTRVVGEFYWRVRAGDAVEAESFISEDGQSLSLERKGDEEQWTHLVPIPRRWVEGFTRPQGPDLAHPTPERPQAEAKRGWWGAMPGRGAGDLAPMLIMAAITAVLCWVILGWSAQGQQQAGVETNVIVDGPEVHFTVGQVNVAQPYHYVSIYVEGSPFVNRWVDIDWRLVNRATQQAITASSTLEYYTGSDSDGAWSEGNHQHTALIASVPRGTYDLVASAQAKRWNDPAVAYSPPADPFEGGGEPIKLRIGVATGGDNTGWRILLVVLALAWPGVILLWRRAKD